MYFIIICSYWPTLFIQFKRYSYLFQSGTFRDARVQREDEEGTSNAVIAETIEYVNASEASSATVVPSYESLYSSMLANRSIPANAIYTELVNVKSISSAIENEDSSDKFLQYINFGDIQTAEHL